MSLCALFKQTAESCPANVADVSVVVSSTSVDDVNKSWFQVRQLPGETCTIPVMYICSVLAMALYRGVGVLKKAHARVDGIVGDYYFTTVRRKPKRTKIILRVRKKKQPFFAPHAPSSDHQLRHISRVLNSLCNDVLVQVVRIKPAASGAINHRCASVYVVTNNN